MGGDGRNHLRKVASRHPRTITEINIEKDGGLKYVRQALIGDAPPLEANRLLLYVWGFEGANWYGRSMLRPCFRDWLVKDRLIRVDAVKHERQGMGVPWFETGPELTQQQVNALAATARRIKAGEESGGAGPGKLRIAGVEGSLPDTVGSMRFHNEEMAKAFFQLFFSLGTSETGSRALGSEFIDLYAYCQEVIADWVRWTFSTYLIYRLVDWNYTTDPEQPEQSPLLVYERAEGEDLPISDLMALVERDVVELDPEMEEWVQRRFKAPIKFKQAAPPAGQGGTSNPPATARAEVKQKLLAAAGRPMPWAELSRAAGREPKDGTARRAREELVAEGRLEQRAEGWVRCQAGAGAVSLPDRELRRQPYAQEVQAAVDFAAIDGLIVSERDALVADLHSAQEEQIAAVAAAVEDAGGDAGKLIALEVEPIDSEIIASRMRAAARAGYDTAEAEMRAQGAEPPASAAAADDQERDEQLNERAAVIAAVLAGSLREVASRKAIALSTGALSAAAVAEQVRDHLEGLSDAFLAEQATGAVMEGMNTGRRQHMREHGPDEIYASELLDENTCAECRSVDGKDYDDVDAAEVDYPAGGYRYCAGGLRCRGTLVATYGEVAL